MTPEVRKKLEEMADTWVYQNVDATPDVPYFSEVFLAGAQAGWKEALEQAAQCIENNHHAIANPMREEFTAEHMQELRNLCKEMWAADIRALAEEKSDES